MCVRLENGAVISTDDIRKVEILKRQTKNCQAYEIWLFMNDGSKIKAATEYSLQIAAFHANYFKPGCVVWRNNDE